MSHIYTHAQSGLPVIIDHRGEHRTLGSIPSNGKMKALLPNYTAAGNPVIPLADRKLLKLNRRALFGGRDWILNQAQHGSCVGNGFAGALRRARVLQGQIDIKLSPGYWYSLVNGDSDNGAVVSDCLNDGQNCTCSYATVGEDPIYQRQMPAAAKAEAQRFKIKSAYQCDTWDEVCSAIATGVFIPVYGYMVGNSFENFDKYGVAGHSRGPGNHCNHADDLAYLPDGREVLDDVNSWDFPWGPFQNGRVYLDEQHLFGGGDQPDVCVIEYGIDDPNAPEPPIVN